jgi:membrane-associated protein
LKEALEFIRHLDVHLADMATRYGVWIYAIVAAVIFAETAFVIFPFLPGDSLLFAIGLIATNEKNNLSVPGMFILLTSAAILGNVVNYWVGKFFGERFSQSKNPVMKKIFSEGNLKKTSQFFENYGGKAIVITRFVPVVRAFAPFVAGMGAMEFPKFMVFNVIGGALWVGVCMFAGVFLGEIPVVKQNFELAILGLVIISVAPIIIEFVMHRRRAKKEFLAAQEAKTSE